MILIKSAALVIVTREALARGGNINRVRFEAEKLEFDSESWRGENVRLTNDPFSPPESKFVPRKQLFAI